MLPPIHLDPQSSEPLYRQLYRNLRDLIDSGQFDKGARLPATRELAGQLGLNRTTISAAYELLESEGLITGHVGRGSFVAGSSNSSSAFEWRDILKEPPSSAPATSPAVRISFATSRPSELLFPLEDFRATCEEVIHGADAHTILQLGSPSGYAPLRRYLIDKSRTEGVAEEADDIVITSGVQQAFDLLQRTLAADGETVLIEDPVYSGLRNVFQRGGARMVGLPVGPHGLELGALERAMAKERPRLLVVTSNFQNPTGATLPLASRKAILALAQRFGVIIIENDIYGPLCYEGDPIATIKQLDDSGHTVLLRSFSKLAFPGLRVGWAIAPRALIEKLTEAKQISDLHTDQLSQAVLLRFAESGRLENHRTLMLTAGRERLRATLAACEKYLPEGAAYTRPRGGMNLWIRLPQPLDAGELLARAERVGVTYLPGRYFAVTNMEASALRISFAGLAPDLIKTGLSVLGRIFQEGLERTRSQSRLEVPAMV